MIFKNCHLIRMGNKVRGNDRCKVGLKLFYALRPGRHGSAKEFQFTGLPIANSKANPSQRQKIIKTLRYWTFVRIAGGYSEKSQQCGGNVVPIMTSSWHANKLLFQAWFHLVCRQTRAERPIMPPFSCCNNSGYERTYVVLWQDTALIRAWGQFILGVA